MSFVALRRADHEETALGMDASSLFLMIAETSPDIIFVYDLRERRCLFVNGRCEESFGYTAKYIRRLHTDDLLGLVHPEDHQQVRANFARQLRMTDNEISEMRCRFARATGGYRVLRCQQRVFSLGPGAEVRCVLGIASDITDQVNRATELSEMKAEIMFARSDERKCIAQKLHDTAVQDLVGAGFLLDRLESFQRGHGGAPTSAVAEVRTLLSRALREIVELK